jgi:hypothetical protein
VAAAGDAAQPAEPPITAHISAAVPIHLLLGFDSDRRTAPPERPATDGPDAALVPWGLVESYSLMMVPPSQAAMTQRDCQPFRQGAVKQRCPCWDRTDVAFAFGRAGGGHPSRVPLAAGRGVSASGLDKGSECLRAAVRCWPPWPQVRSPGAPARGALPPVACPPPARRAATASGPSAVAPQTAPAAASAITRAQVVARYGRLKSRTWGFGAPGVLRVLPTRRRVLALTFDACGGVSRRASSGPAPRTATTSRNVSSPIWGSASSASASTATGAPPSPPSKSSPPLPPPVTAPS